MFTGLVSDVGTILSIEERGALRRLRIATAYAPETIALGASIACNGPCLTAVAMGVDAGQGWFEVDAAAETLAVTTVGQWRAGSRVNLERSLRLGDELGGHIVTGHVDGVARIEKRDAFDGMTRFDVVAPHNLSRFIAAKGSVSLDGVSLTVNSVEGDRFSVLLIPHTLAFTGWGERVEGDAINLEIDLMARYAARLDDTRRAEAAGRMMKAHYAMFARYNAWANARLYDAVGRLSETDRRRDMGAFFKSAHNTLNHLVVTDRIWMRRFTGEGPTYDRLDATPYDDFAELLGARVAEDRRIAAYVEALDEDALAGMFHYVRVSAPDPVSQALAPALAHFFNHQTHHRGQTHAIVTALGGEGPTLDLVAYQRLRGEDV